MNQFKICDKNKLSSVEGFVTKLKEIDANAEVIIGCQNICGICRTKPFTIVNGMPIIADTEDDLILKIKEKVKK